MHSDLNPDLNSSVIWHSTNTRFNLEIWPDVLYTVKGFQIIEHLDSVQNTREPHNQVVIFVKELSRKLDVLRNNVI